MSKYYLSFCVPTYNSKSAIRVIRNILKSNNNNIQVVVCDDASTDNTYRDIIAINDNRLKVCRNEVNLGAKLNWYNTLNEGDGEWLYLVMARDYIDYLKMDRVIDYLKAVEEKGIDLCLDRGGKDVEYLFGLEAAISCINSDHPTGIIMRRDAYRNLSGREKYFKIDGYTYPENYIKRDLMKNGVAIIPRSLYTGQTMLSLEFNKSEVYRNNFNDIWFMPHNRINDCIRNILMVLNCDYELISRNQYDVYISEQYKRLMKFVSLDYKRIMISREYTGHYGLACRETTKKEICNNIKEAYVEVIQGIQMKNNVNIKMHIQLSMITLYWIVQIWRCE